MYGEPSVYEYAQMLNEADKRISTDGFKCSHNNLGWVGYYITTPKGKKFELVQKDWLYSDKGYTLCYPTKYFGMCGMPTGQEFKTLEECKTYLLELESDTGEEKMKIYHYKNEGPFCGCWADGWVIVLPNATNKEIADAKDAAAQELTEIVYELCVDENEYDSMDEEDLYLERDEEIATDCSCAGFNFDTEASESWEELLSYGLTQIWNENHTVCYMISQ
jgi:hypothetical protein